MNGGSTILVADIGGTNARFAVARKGALGASITLKVAEFNEGGRLVRAALAALDGVVPDRICLALAGPVRGRRAELTNGELTFDADGLASILGGVPVTLYNDLQAAALALPHLQMGDMRALGPKIEEPNQRLPRALMSVGTGLGISCFVPSELGGGTALATEGGHATLPATTSQERRILAALAERHDHVSCERILSGKGLTLLYQAITGVAGGGPDAIVASAISGNGEAVAVLNQFCAFMGSVAGNLALTYGAWGGVFVGGGVPTRFADFLANSPFRRRFEAKDRFAEHLASVPTHLILRDDVALLGLAKSRISK